MLVSNSAFYVLEEVKEYYTQQGFSEIGINFISEIDTPFQQRKARMLG